MTWLDIAIIAALAVWCLYMAFVRFIQRAGKR